MGQKYHPSGYQLFMKWNVQLLQCGGSVQASAPIAMYETDILELQSVTNGFPGQMDVNLYKTGPLQIDAAYVVIFRAGPWLSGGRRPIEPEYPIRIAAQILFSPCFLYIAVVTRALNKTWSGCRV